MHLSYLGAGFFISVDSSCFLCYQLSCYMCLYSPSSLNFVALKILRQHWKIDDNYAPANSVDVVVVSVGLLDTNL